MSEFYPYYFFNDELFDAREKVITQDNIITRFLPQTIFETVLVENGQPLFLSEHLERLVRSVDVLGSFLSLPPGEGKFIFKACWQQCKIIFLFMPIFAILIAKIGIGIKKISALPERPIKIFLKVFKPFESAPKGRGSQSQVENKSIIKFVIANIVKQSPNLEKLLNLEVSTVKAPKSPKGALFYQDLIKEQVARLIKKNKIKRARLNIFFGSFENKAEKNILISLKPLADNYLKAKVRLTLKHAQKRSSLHQHKLLMNIQNDATENSDFLYFDDENNILETSRANVFFIKGNLLITPIAQNIIPGIMRDQIIERHQELGFALEIRSIKNTELSEFDEVFLTNSLKGVIEVAKVDGFNLSSKEQTEKIFILRQTQHALLFNLPFQ
ncbi:MAG: aminotransferase class IV [Candidatus Margulisiibacteriota bacterium]|jgi:branched-subunit amino acid aminotransferase/4-amino-4-deoxychorismate lyase